MNIAIVLAVSKYSNPSNNLLASKKDGDIIHGILKSSKKFDNILVVNDNESSSTTKEMLSNFFIENKTKNISEFFFYYSGHGEFSNGEFYYLLPDFDSKKKNQTSLQNTEIDNLIRTLNPKIVIKVIDACQSGTSYIKESNVLSKYFDDTSKGFNKCYFLNSSLSTQSSYQDENLSFFTHSFIQSLKQHNSSEIRYKDIIDFILDDFSGNSDQTPFFVIQAELTEKFCTLDVDLKDYLSTYGLSNKSGNEEEIKKLTLLQIIKKNAEDYIDKEGAIKAFNFIKNQFERLNIDKELKNLYDTQVNFIEDQNTLPGIQSIGNWLKDNNNDFFAKPKYSDDYDEYGDEYTYLSGYSFLVNEVPYKAISIEISSKFPNLKSYRCNISILISKKEISFFYVIMQYLEDGWDTKIVDTEKLKWTYTTKKIAYESSISDGINGIILAINNQIQSDINTQFGLQVEEDDLPF